ncbi:hypothetical protein D3C72_974710 [compost metagenome]
MQPRTVQQASDRLGLVKLAFDCARASPPYSGFGNQDLQIGLPGECRDAPHRLLGGKMIGACLSIRPTWNRQTDSRAYQGQPPIEGQGGRRLRPAYRR